MLPEEALSWQQMLAPWFVFGTLQLGGEKVNKNSGKWNEGNQVVLMKLK